jgi:hypothetical protein
MDIAESIKAENDLRNLKMQGSNIDTYIVTFTKLLKMAGYQEPKHRSLSIFKKGLLNGLNICIIDNSPTPPNTLKGWIEATHQEQLKYLQTQVFRTKRSSHPKLWPLLNDSELEPTRIIVIQMLWTLILEISAVEVLPPLAMKKSRSYKTLADVLDARRKDTFPSSVPLGRIETLSIGDQPPPRMPIVA